MDPELVIRLMASSSVPPVSLVDHKSPSDPAAIHSGWTPLSRKTVIVPFVVIRLIVSVFALVNHRESSGPAVISPGPSIARGTVLVKFDTTPLVVMRPMDPQ